MARYTGEPDFYNNNMFGVASTGAANDFNTQVAENINYGTLPGATQKFTPSWPMGSSMNLGVKEWLGNNPQPTKADFVEALESGQFGGATSGAFSKNVDELFGGTNLDAKTFSTEFGDVNPEFISPKGSFGGNIDINKSQLSEDALESLPKGFWRDDEASLKNLLDNRYVDSAMFATDANIVDDVNENETWTLPQRDWGPVRRTEALPPRGRLDTFLQRFGVPPMTQVTAADKRANKQFMGQQGIVRDPQTGRMIGGDFEGKNAPGTSGWGSANFGEMAQKWDEEYGDMVYKTDKMKAKQARIKAQAAAYAQKVAAERQERIRNERAAANAANQATQRRAGKGGSHMSRSVGQGGLGISASQAQAVSDANRAAGMGGWGLAHGGRVGYKTGGRVGILAAF